MAWMLRFALVAVVCSYTVPVFAASSTEDEASLRTTLALQQAMAQARGLLLEAKAKNAVDTLEEQLPRANGHLAFMRLLREAYRQYIKDLWLANQQESAQRYLGRLCIIEPMAAHDPTLRPPQAAEKKTIQPPPPPVTQEKPPLPNFAQKSPAKTDKIGQLTTGPKPTVARGKTYADGDYDPFAMEYQHPQARLGEQKRLAAQQFLAQAEEEFSRRRFAEARVLYEKAGEADQPTALASRERWAYCMLNQVVEQFNRNDLGGATPIQLKSQVERAVAMAPGLNDTGKWLLREIQLRHGNQIAAAGPAEKVGPGTPPSVGEGRTVSMPAVRVQHLGQNPQGWQVAESRNFRIFHQQGRDFAERVAQVAERTRFDMSHKWFGQDSADWQPKCDILLHPTGAEYTRLTGVPATSPGHSRIETDPRNHERVVNRRMELRCDVVGFLEAVLPHETTHVVLAGNFGNHLVPRWADEGMAVLSEPTDKIDQHRRNLIQAKNQLFRVKELMELNDYPNSKRISAFYAQSVVLVDFLAQQRGPTVFSQFLRDGLRGGYEAALRQHYGWTMEELETRWQRHIGGMQVAER
jgi:hypothetical protein